MIIMTSVLLFSNMARNANPIIHQVWLLLLLLLFLFCSPFQSSFLVKYLTHENNSHWIKRRNIMEWLHLIEIS